MTYVRMQRSDRARVGLELAVVLLASLLGALGCSKDESGDSRDRGGGAASGAGTDARADSGIDFGDQPVPVTDAGTITVPQVEALTLEPALVTLVVTEDDPMPSVTFVLRSGDDEVEASKFSVADVDFGDIAADGTFTASGNIAGMTGVEARFGDKSVFASLTVRIEREQNGGEDDGSGADSGGYGGVGGEGPGGPVDDDTKDVLDDDTPNDDDSLKWLYPYDETVFPLGLLSPLLMWTESSEGAVEAIALHIHGGEYDYRGYFGRPPSLDDAAPFVRHPIPQEVWQAATLSARGTMLTIELTVAIDGKAYGPIERKLKIADGKLKGTVYYQSYGTDLAKNLDGAQGGDGRFGGATLAIRPGEHEPRLVAGGDGDHAQCRVCHSVASRGARMIVQHGDDYPRSSSYDLLNGNAEQAYDQNTSSLLGWIGMTPDGALGLGNTTTLGYDGPPTTQLYDLSDGSVVPSTGLTDFVELAGFPAFSHDGTRVAFNFGSGPGDSSIGAGDGKKLVVMDFDPATNSFDDPQLIHEGDRDPGWPSFTPDGNSVVFESLIQSGDQYFYTRDGGKGELWWVNLVTGESHALDRANGKDYLPVGANAHDLDHELGYEPTVAPIASGGYAWIVFTSRRMYGNVATIDPWISDPREYDHTLEITPKKLWVAAIELNVGTELDGETIMSMLPDDPSHPAFYLPGQELHAGNTRGFWVVDPCKADGASCESGVDCCGGRCARDPNTDERTCDPGMDECAQEFDACEKSSDCCDTTLVCLNDICSKIMVN